MLKLTARATLVALIGLVAVAGRPDADSDLDGIRLAVFRQQVAFWLDGHARESGVVVCLSIEEDGVSRSVSKEYLRYFPGEDAVRVGAACEEHRAGAIERETGRPAILLTVGEVSRRAADEVWVETRHFRSAVLSGIRTQRVVRDQSGWRCLGQVVKDVPL